MTIRFHIDIKLPIQFINPEYFLFLREGSGEVSEHDLYQFLT